MTNIAIMAPDAASAGYGPNGGLATSIKYATITTEQNPYMGAKGVNAGLTSLTYATITTEKDPYAGVFLRFSAKASRPASGQLWPRGNY